MAAYLGEALTLSPIFTRNFHCKARVGGVAAFIAIGQDDLHAISATGFARWKGPIASDAILSSPEVRRCQPAFLYPGRFP